jgi:hypothetical protein
MGSENSEIEQQFSYSDIAHALLPRAKMPAVVPIGAHSADVETTSEHICTINRREHTLATAYAVSVMWVLASAQVYAPAVVLQFT